MTFLAYFIVALVALFLFACIGLLFWAEFGKRQWEGRTEKERGRLWLVLRTVEPGRAIGKQIVAVPVDNLDALTRYAAGRRWYFSPSMSGMQYVFAPLRPLELFVELRE